MSRTYAVRIVRPGLILDYTLNAKTGPKARKEAGMLLVGFGAGAIVTLKRINANGTHVPVVLGIRRKASTRWTTQGL